MDHSEPVSYTVTFSTKVELQKVVLSRLNWPTAASLKYLSQEAVESLQEGGSNRTDPMK